MGKSEQAKKNKRKNLQKESEELQDICLYEDWEVEELFLNSKRRFATDRSKHMTHADLRRFFRYKVIPKYVISLMGEITNEMKENTRKQEKRLKEERAEENKKTNYNRTYRCNYIKVYNMKLR